jgi:NAD(P)-dependent dehydrogenase (short-subunit alcohol dehydrogenase family)
MGGRFEGKVALVTGASSGIGAATARAFGAEGAAVVLADLREDAGQQLARGIEAGGGRATFIKTDVTRADDARAMVDRTIERYGRLDVAVNNAGILPRATPLAALAEAEFDRILAINLKGVFLGMKQEIARMLTQEPVAPSGSLGGRGTPSRGVIVNMTSFAALVGLPGFAAYVASKHGIAGLTRTAALEYAAHGVRINAVAPGVVRTPMFEALPAEARAGVVALEPIGRVAEPEEVASAILFLASDEASYLVGHVMSVDGGLTVA